MKNKSDKSKKLPNLEGYKTTVLYPPTCILCNKPIDAEKEGHAKALWVDPIKRRTVWYFLCLKCYDEFRNFPKNDRTALVTNFIEKKIDELMELIPHIKTSENKAAKKAIIRLFNIKGERAEWKHTSKSVKGFKGRTN